MDAKDLDLTPEQQARLDQILNAPAVNGQSHAHVVEPDDEPGPMAFIAMMAAEIVEIAADLDGEFGFDDEDNPEFVAVQDVSSALHLALDELERLHERLHDGRPCYDCDQPTAALYPDDPPGNQYEYYMVHDEVWRAAGGMNWYLCIGCLEKRLGRELNSGDFTDFPINKDPDLHPRRSDRLRDRLSRPAES